MKSYNLQQQTEFWLHKLKEIFVASIYYFQIGNLFTNIYNESEIQDAKWFMIWF